MGYWLPAQARIDGANFVHQRTIMDHMIETAPAKEVPLQATTTPGRWLLHPGPIHAFVESLLVLAVLILLMVIASPSLSDDFVVRNRLFISIGTLFLFALR